MTGKFTSLLCFLASLAFAIAPFLTDGFNGFTPDQFPVPQIDPPIQPAGYAFAIWGLLYLWLILGTGFGLAKRSESDDWARHRAPLMASLLVGATWIAVAQISVLYATVLIWAMLITALAALLRAGQRDHWLQTAPIGAYAGWLTAASCLSIGLMLAGFGYTSDTTAAYIGLALALAIAAVICAKRPDTPAYPATLIWALVGIITGNFEPLNTGVIALAALGITYLLFPTVKAARQASS